MNQPIKTLDIRPPMGYIVCMREFIVTVQERWSALVVVEAIDEDHAIDLVKAGRGDFGDGLEFVERLSSDTWDVEEL